MQFWYWLDTRQGLLTTLVFLVIFVLAVWWVWKFSKRYVGIGTVFGYYNSEGKALNGVFVLSRLLDSPAHKAGLQKWDQLLEYNGTPMQFDTQGALTEFFKKELRTSRVGDRVRCKIKRNKKVFDIVAEAAVIQGSIPVHLPQVFSSPHDDDYGDYHYGLVVCERTGEWVPTMRLSDGKLMRIFGQSR